MVSTHTRQLSPVTDLAERNEVTEPHKSEELPAEETPAQRFTFQSECSLPILSETLEESIF